MISEKTENIMSQPINFSMDSKEPDSLTKLGSSSKILESPAINKDAINRTTEGTVTSNSNSITGTDSPANNNMKRGSFDLALANANMPSSLLIVPIDEVTEHTMETRETYLDKQTNHSKRSTPDRRTEAESP